MPRAISRIPGYQDHEVRVGHPAGYHSDKIVTHEVKCAEAVKMSPAAPATRNVSDPMQA